MQQAVFDGEAESADLIAAARRVCATCPVLRECQVYAEESLDESTFLAGQTADERSADLRRAATTRHRRTVVDRMATAGVSHKEISFYTEYPLRSIEADVARAAASSGR